MKKTYKNKEEMLGRMHEHDESKLTSQFVCLRTKVILCFFLI